MYVKDNIQSAFGFLTWTWLLLVKTFLQNEENLHGISQTLLVNLAV